MANTTEETCCICLTEYSDHDARFTLACGHHVHSDCMLRVCLTRTGDVRCPYCRAQLSIGSRAETTEETEVETESEDGISGVIEEPGSSQWTSLEWTDLASSRRSKLQETIVRRMFGRARCIRAPGVLKRCSEKYRDLLREVADLRSSSNQFKQSKARGTVKEVLVQVQRYQKKLLALDKKIKTHLKSSLRRCQGSVSVVEYFQRYPLAHVAVE